jgi:hypothetical protein
MDERDLRELIRSARAGLLSHVVIVPIVWRSNISAVSNKLKNTEICGWDSSSWNLARWYREA